MKTHFALLTISCALLISCTFAPDNESTSSTIPVPGFINENSPSRSIQMEITDEWEEEARLIYLTQGPLINSFQQESVMGNTVEAEIAGETLNLTIEETDTGIHYEGQSESIYVEIHLDKSTMAFSYKQIVFIDADYKGEEQHFASIAEGSNLKIKDDNGIEGSFRSLLFTSQGGGYAQIFTGELYSDSRRSAIALLLSYPYTGDTTLPSMEEAKAISVMDIDTADYETMDSLRLYWQESNAFTVVDYFLQEEPNGNADTEERFEYIKNEAAALFDGKWSIESPVQPGTPSE